MNQSFVDAAAERMRAELNACREAISRELCAIPPPVPACDVNFNRLLEERSRIVDELQRLARLRASHARADELVAFCRASTGLDAETKAAIEGMLSRFFVIQDRASRSPPTPLPGGEGSS